MQEEHKDDHPHQDISLKDLLDIQKWQKIQDDFYVITGICLRIVSPEGSLIASSCEKTKLCAELLRNSPAKSRLCGTCLPTFLSGKAVVDKNLSFYCEAGLYNFISPLMAHTDKILGYLMMGPVILVMRQPQEAYAAIAHEFGVELEDFWNALLKIKTISFHYAQSLMTVIQDVAEYMLKSSLPCSGEKQSPLSALDKPTLTKRFEAFLDVAFELSKADIGSVMFLHKPAKELTIEAAKGIPDAIVKNTRVKLGNGIAGLAAEEGRPLLLDNTLADNRLLQYFKKPHLNSSMVIPLKTEEGGVLGVLNVGALNTSQVRFNKNTLQMMDIFAGLAAVTMLP